MSGPPAVSITQSSSLFYLTFTQHEIVLIAPVRLGRAAVFNTLIVGTLAILLFSLLCFVSAKTGSLSKAWIFYEGSCTETTNINLFLHLLLNIISTLIIASSNFFMQILNAPTSYEVDRAHAKNRSLEFGGFLFYCV